MKQVHTRLQRSGDRGKQLHGMRRIVHDVEQRDQVIRAGYAFGHIADRVAHRVVQARGARVRGGSGNRGRVVVVANQGRLGIGTRQCQECLPVATTDVGSAAAVAERGIDTRDRRDPVLVQEVLEGSTGEALEATPEPIAKFGLRDPAAMQEGLGQLVDMPPRRFAHAEHRAEVEGTVGVGQHERVLGRESEPSRLGVVLQVAVACHRGQPLAGVALVESGARGELGRGDRDDLGQCLPQTQPVADSGKRPHLLGRDIAEDLEGETLDDFHVQLGNGSGHRVNLRLWDACQHGRPYGQPRPLEAGISAAGSARERVNRQAYYRRDVVQATRPFVGRQQELALLRAAFDRAAAGQGGVVAVLGEPGIGKTTLCERAADYANHRGGRVLIGHCYEQSLLSLPYLPFIEALNGYVLACDPQQLRSELGPGAGYVARGHAAVGATPRYRADRTSWRCGGRALPRARCADRILASCSRASVHRCGSGRFARSRPGHARLLASDAGAADYSAALSTIPEGLRAVIGQRLARLSPPTLQLLSVAAVVGREFDVSVLQSIAGLGEDGLASAIQEALRAGRLHEHARPGSLRYRFAHALFCQTLYEEVVGPRRVRLHQQVVRMLENRYAVHLDVHAAELAEHFARSTDPDDLAKAIVYHERAAHSAVGVAAFGEAADAYRQALQLLGAVEPHADLGAL